MIAILDYDAGNLTSVKKAVDYLGYPCLVTFDPREVGRADKIMLPGVGHFSATSNLEARGLSTIVRDAISRNRTEAVCSSRAEVSAPEVGPGSGGRYHRRDGERVDRRVGPLVSQLS